MRLLQSSGEMPTTPSFCTMSLWRPPTTDIMYGPKANPYYNAACNPDVDWCEPPLIPAVPNLSMGMEAFA